MFETIYDLIQDPSNFANWMALIECIIALVAFAIGVVIVLCYPAFAIVGVVMMALGVAGLVVGHL